MRRNASHCEDRSDFSLAKEAPPSALLFAALKMNRKWVFFMLTCNSYVFVFICVQLCLHMYAHARNPEVIVRLLPQALSPLGFEAGSLTYT